MSESHAEQLDESVLGEDDTDDIEAGSPDASPTAGFPPDQPLGVDDPAILSDGSIAEDDYAAREARHRHAGDPDDERDERDDSRASDEPAPALIEPGADPDVLDDEQQLIADEADEGDLDTSPEAAAVHITDDRS